ncbi:MAG: ABC transporter ATP-binding protein [Pseudomonadota bacterium]
MSVLLRVNQITKVFGTLKANDNVDLDVLSGEIHALLGENGAGKSTLVKMLFGSLQPDGGQIFWREKPVSIPNPSAARALGVGMVHQHFSLFDSLTVAENIALALDAMESLRDIAKQARELGEAYGLELRPDALVGDLSVGERQRVEIIRCLLQKPELIILDEPTSVLTPQEADRLFETLRQLQSEGKAILYISHRLDEVKELCDRATVLRHGKVVASCDPRKETAQSLAAMMVGSDVADVRKATGEATSDAEKQIVFAVHGLSQKPLGPFSVALKNIDIKLRAGEVLGIAGVAGNGQSELFDALSGEEVQANPAVIEIAGKPAGNLGPNGRRKLGAAFAPEERMGHAAVGSMRLSENVLLSRHVSDASAYKSGGILRFIQPSALKRTLGRVVEAMDVRKSGDDPSAATLSGGNLQKLVLGREFDRKPRVLIFNQPTWGVDAGAAARIRQTIIDATAEGSAALIISQDLDELFAISDKIAVMHDGHLSRPLDAATTTRNQIGLLMGGAEPGQIGEAA